jgi:hypothetical protein
MNFKLNKNMNKVMMENQFNLKIRKNYQMVQRILEEEVLKNELKNKEALLLNKQLTQ